MKRPRKRPKSLPSKSYNIFIQTHQGREGKGNPETQITARKGLRQAIIARCPEGEAGCRGKLKSRQRKG